MEFRILGPLEVVEGDRALPLGGAKQRALLAILLSHANRAVSTDRLIDDLWGDEPPATAGNILQVYVSQLRKVLRAGSSRRADQILITQRPGYAIQIGPDELDLSRFEHLSVEGREALSSDEPAVASVKLRSALALFRGQPLADFVFDAFAQPEIERLEEFRIAVTEDRIAADLALARHAELVGELEALIRDHPLRERLREHLMLAFYRAGRQAEALQVYQETLHVLGEELGIDPNPALQRLHEAILQQDPSLEIPTVPRPHPAGVEEPTPATEPILDLAPPATPTSSEPAVADAEPDDQFLPVTALFADIVSSTSLAEGLSPEEVRAVIGECVGRMSRAVESFGGTIQAYMGDGICAYFGVPTGHEDDHERAALAALRIQQMVEGYAREIEGAWGIAGFSVRIGMNSGRTVVGFVGAGAPQQVAFGDATNVASRLQTEADPGTILVGGSLAQRLGSTFSLEPVGPLRVKGREEAVAAWRLTGEQGVLDSVPATPLVGRQREMTVLETVTGELVLGRGQILLVLGDAGIGKTRMLAELHELIGPQATWLDGRCRAYEGDLPFWPFVEAFRSWLDVGERDPELSVRTKLLAKLDGLLGEAEAAELRPFLGRLLFLRTDVAGEEFLAAMPADELEERIRGAFVAWAESIAARGPSVIAIDDAHVADAPTLRLLRELLPIVDREALLVVAASREEPSTKGWRSLLDIQSEFKHRTTQMTLEALPDDAAAELADALVPPGTLESHTSHEIVARAEGNPLYLEELVRLLVDSGGLARDRSGSLSFSRSVLVLPPALESLLIARLQQLPVEARRLAQIAAVVGREFAVRIVQRVAGDDNRDGLTVLLRSEVIRELRRRPEFECVFRHGLMREAALSTITPARAKELYGQVAEAFEELHADSIDEHLERLAFYSYRSDQPTKAVAYLERAGIHAAEMNVTARWEELLRRARQLASRTGDDEAGRRLDRLLGESVTVGGDDGSLE